jgi:uncharacterized protein (UPF0248 family)
MEEPLLIGINHEDENLEAVSAEIERLADKGIKRIGIENFHSLETPKQLLQLIDSTPGRRGVKDQVYNVIHNMLMQEDRENAFWMQLKKVAEKKGMKVFFIESDFYPSTANRMLMKLALPKIIARVARLKEKNPRLRFKKIENILLHESNWAISQYPVNHLITNIRDQVMKRENIRQKVQVVITGLRHTYALAHAMGIPIHRITIIDHQKVRRAPHGFFRRLWLRKKHYDALKENASIAHLRKTRRKAHH